MSSPEDPASGLDDEQRAAVAAPRAGVRARGCRHGKTRTITRRIAHLVRAGHVAPGQVLAVTFTARAAGEMRTRLRALGVSGVQARTFHAAALRQLRYFWPQVVGGEQRQLLEGKLRFVGQAAARARAGTDAASLRDLAGEIEWAKANAGHARRLSGGGRPAASRHPGSRRAGRRRLRRVRGAQEPRRAARLRRPAAAHRGRPGGAPRRRRGVPRPLSLLRRRRVPGRHSAAAAGARRVARRARRPDRRRRREPDDLHLRRRGPAAPARLPATPPRGRGGAPHARLPLHAAGRVGGEHADRRRARPCRGEAPAARRAAAAGAGPAVPGVRRRARRGRRRRPGDPAADRRRHTCRRDRGAVPRQRAVGGLRAGAHQGRGALPGAGRGAVLRAAGGAAGHDGRPSGRPGPDGPLPDVVRAVLEPVGLTAEPPGGAAQRAQWESLLALVELAEELVAVEPSADLRRFSAELDARADAAHPPRCRASPWRRCTRRRVSSGTRCTSSAWSTGRCRSSTPRATMRRSRRSGACSTSGSPGRGGCVAVVGAVRQPGGGRRRRRSRFLYGLIPDEHPAARVPVGGPGRRGEAAVPGVRQAAARHDGDEAAPLRRLPVGRRRRAARPVEGLAAQHGEGTAGPAYVVFTDATLTAIAEQRPADTSALVAIPGIGANKLDRYGEAVLALVAEGGDGRTSRK